MRRLTAALIVAVGLSAVTPAVAGSPAIHVTEDVTGDVVTCDGTELTAAGSFRITLHEGSAASGNENFTGTGVPDVTFTDASGNTYQLAGALWFGGAFNAQQQTFVFTDTEHFVILNAGGGLFGRISITSHLSANGKEFSLNMGNCIPPDEDEES
jgi:hypothetical protein